MFKIRVVYLPYTYNENSDNVELRETCDISIKISHLGYKWEFLVRPALK